MKNLEDKMILKQKRIVQKINDKYIKLCYNLDEDKK